MTHSFLVDLFRKICFTVVPILIYTCREVAGNKLNSSLFISTTQNVYPKISPNFKIHPCIHTYFNQVFIWHQNDMREFYQNISRKKQNILLVFLRHKNLILCHFYSFQKYTNWNFASTCFVKHLKDSQFYASMPHKSPVLLWILFWILLNVVKINYWLSIMRSVGNEKIHSRLNCCLKRARKMYLYSRWFSICDCSYEYFKRLITILLCLHFETPHGFLVCSKSKIGINLLY